MLEQHKDEDEKHDTRELDRTPNGCQKLAHELQRMGTEFAWLEHRHPRQRCWPGVLDITGVDGERRCGFADLDQATRFISEPQ